MTVRLRDVHKRYGPRDVLAGVSLDLAPGLILKSSYSLERIFPICSTGMTEGVPPPR